MLCFKKERRIDLTTIKKLFTCFLFFLLITFPFTNLFKVTFVEGHDFLFHMWRIIALKKEVDAGNILPSWLPDALDGFGAPVFSIIYGFPYYVAVVLLKLGLGFDMSQKLVMFLPGPLSGIVMYAWLKKRFGLIESFVGSILYIWTPYHFLVTYIRGAIGEMYFFLFFPLVLFLLDSAPKYRSAFFTPLSMALLIYSHNSLAMITLPIFVGYILVRYLEHRNAEILKTQLISLLFGILLSAFYVVPALQFSTLLHNASNSLKHLWFVPLKAYLWSKWEGGSVFDGQMLIMSFKLGWANILVMLLSILAFIRGLLKKSKQFDLTYWCFICLSTLVLQLYVSQILWRFIPLLINIQFPYRLLAFTLVTTSVLASVILSLVKRPVLKVGLAFIMVCLALVGNRNHLLARQANISIEELRSYSGSYDGSGEFLPTYFDYSAYESSAAANTIPQDFEVFGRGKIIQKMRESYVSRVRVEMYEPGEVYVKRMYFPGWQVRVDGSELSGITKGNGIWVPVGKGVHEVVVSYTLPGVIIFSRYLSLATLAAMCGTVLLKPGLLSKKDKKYGTI